MFTNLIPNKEEAEGFEKERADLLDRFNGSALLAAKTEKQRNHLLRGDKVMFVIQDEVLASLGEDRTIFRAMYEVLSSHVHSYPLAYHRMLTGGRGDGVENNPEKDWMMIMLEYVRPFLARAVTQMLQLFPDIPDPRLRGIAALKRA